MESHTCLIYLAIGFSIPFIVTSCKLTKHFFTASSILYASALFLRLKNNVTVFVPVAIKVLEPISAIANTSKYFNIISLDSV